MASVTEQDRATFRERGYVVIPNALSDRQVGEGRRVVAALLAAEPPAAGHTGFYFLWPTFARGTHALLDFYREAGIGELAAGLVRPGLPVDEPDRAQVATTIPPWRHRPGGPHLDGLTPPEAGGRPGTFTLLSAVWLSDQTQRNQGNLWVWPETHRRSGAYFAEHGADALSRLAETSPGPYPQVELGEPEQATGPAGSVLLAHYLLAHNIGGHNGAAGASPRQTIYYRLLAAGHRQRWRRTVTSPLHEFA